MDSCSAGSGRRHSFVSKVRERAAALLPACAPPPLPRARSLFLHYGVSPPPPSPRPPPTSASSDWPTRATAGRVSIVSLPVRRDCGVCLIRRPLPLRWDIRLSLPIRTPLINRTRFLCFYFLEGCRFFRFFSVECLQRSKNVGSVIQRGGIGRDSRGGN